MVLQTRDLLGTHIRPGGDYQVVIREPFVIGLHRLAFWINGLYACLFEDNVLTPHGPVEREMQVLRFLAKGDVDRVGLKQEVVAVRDYSQVDSVAQLVAQVESAFEPAKPAT
jgi:hypothetical protein